MKNYRLKQWYPSLAISWRTDDRYEYDAGRQVMTNISNVKNGLAIPKEMAIKEQELHPDFWELIEEEKPKPLFVTEDGVNIDQKSSLIVTVVGEDYEISRMFIRDFVKQYPTTTKKVFFVEANADIYIRENNISPFYVTNDNVNIYHPKENVFLVNEFFEKDEGWYNESVGGKVFFHESSADEYIWRNKRLFSYEDIREYFECEGKFYDIKSIAKERSKE